MSTEIAVALIGFAGLVLAAGIAAFAQFHKLRNENSDQHAASYGLIQSIDQRTLVMDGRVTEMSRDIKETDRALRTHLGWHAGHDGRPADQ